MSVSAGPTTRFELAASDSRPGVEIAYRGRLRYRLVA
jgi:hypothetical protein